MRENVGRGGSRKNGRTAWQRVVGYSASRGTGAQAHLTQGYDAAQYVKGAVGLWPHGWGKRKRRASTCRERDKRKRRTRLRLRQG